MGIRGLHTYASANFLYPYELKDTKIIIDGNCVSYRLYNPDEGSNQFVADYTGFSETLRKFFRTLSDSGVTPIIFMDGGSEDKKLPTILNREQERILGACGAMKYEKHKLIPILLKEVMKQVAREMKIVCVQSLLEADDAIASVAKILGCPVLSDDSDFFLYGVDFIPLTFVDLDSLRCKIFKPHHITERFRGLDEKTLPIVAIVLSEEFGNRKTFERFTSTLPRSMERTYNARQISGLLQWLQHQTLQSAISKLLDFVYQSERPQVLKVIEDVVNKYSTVTLNMLPSLGYSDSLARRVVFPPFKYADPCNSTRASLSHRPDFLPLGDGKVTVMAVDEEHLNRIAPDWFIQEFKMARFPSYFIDMMARQMYVCAAQLESSGEPTCTKTSLKIIRVIFSLLRAGIADSNPLRYIARGSNTNIEISELPELDCSDPLPDIPSLESLRSACSQLRCKSILANAMGVSCQLLDEFPSEWALYLATIAYWKKEADKRFTKDCHLYPLLLSALQSVVKSKNQHYTTSVRSSIIDALARIEEEDREIMRDTFGKIRRDEVLSFDPNGIHAFSLFENCLKHSFHLNALLNLPYAETNLARLFDGTFIHKMYFHLKNVNDISHYVNSMIGKSPNSLQLLVAMKDKLSDFWDME